MLDPAGPGPEPVTADPPRSYPRALLTQSWLDLTFVHWAVSPSIVAPLLPAGTVPDTFEGVTYVGLVPFRMHGIGWLGLPGVPYLGSFPETNVRLYSVDGFGRRGVVFRSLDASRLVPVVVGRMGFGLPYVWSRMRISRSGDTVTYVSRRRWPGPAGAASRVTVRLGARIESPSALEHFLTARWGLHSDRAFLPNAHARWPLHRAELVECSQDLTAAAGLPPASELGEPVSVLYSPGVAVRFGRAVRRPA
ncbi:YqjF family protein [Flindersiella endophytica]